MSVDIGIQLLLDMLAERRWHFWTSGPNSVRQVWAATKRWEAMSDVVAIFLDREESEALAYRAPTLYNDDPFAPEFVAWSYLGEPDWTVRAVLGLPPPGKDAGYVEILPSPPACSYLKELSPTQRSHLRPK